MVPSQPQRTDAPSLLRELEGVPREERLAYLAGLPPERQAAFRRIMPRADVEKLNEFIDRTRRQEARPTYDKWIAEARAGRARSPDAMIEVLREVSDRLRPQDALWVSRISDSTTGRSFSKKEAGVIQGIYARYFRAERGVN